MCFYQFLSCFYHVSSMLLISSKNLFLIISSTWHTKPETDPPLPPSSKGQRRNNATARVDLPEPVRPTTAKRSWQTTTVRLSQDFSWKADIPCRGFVVGIHGKWKGFMKNGCWWILFVETYEPLWTMILYEIWQMLINVDKPGCKIYVNNRQVPEVDEHMDEQFMSRQLPEGARAPSGPVGRRPSSGPKEGQVDIVNRPGQVTWSSTHGISDRISWESRSVWDPARRQQKTVPYYTIYIISISICYNYLYDYMTNYEAWSHQPSAILIYLDHENPWANLPEDWPSQRTAERLISLWIPWYRSFGSLQHVVQMTG